MATSSVTVGSGASARATRVNVRDPATGGVARLELEAVDTDGRELRAGAATVGHMALSAGSAGLTINSMLRWDLDGGVTGWGEDQEVWSLPALREYRELRVET